MVRAYAHKRCRPGEHELKDELISDGYTALVEAYNRYDSTKGDFDKYASAYIFKRQSGSVRNYLRSKYGKSEYLDEMHGKEDSSIIRMEEIESANCTIKSLLNKAIGLSPRNDRAIYMTILNKAHGMTVGEIAELIGSNQRFVTKMIAFGLTVLREVYGS